MGLSQRIPIRLTVEGFRSYAEKKDIVALAGKLSQAMSLLEGDIPKPVRESIVWAEAQIDSIRFGVDEKEEPNEVSKVWREIEEILARHNCLPKSSVAEDIDE